MFSKLLSAIKLTRAGFKTYSLFQAKLEAVLKADGDLDGTPTVAELKAVLGDMKANGLVLFEQGKHAAGLIGELVKAAADADHVIALIPTEEGQA